MKYTRSKTWQTRPVHTAVAIVAAHYGIAAQRLRKGEGRMPADVGRRHAAMWLARQLGASMPHITYYMGFDCHTTVVHGCAVVKERQAAEPEFAALCASLLSRALEFRVNNPAILRDTSCGLATSRSTADKSVHRSIAS